MKNNKMLIIIGVVLMNLLVVFMSGQSLLGKDSKYDIALQEARDLADRELYSRAIAAYSDAVTIEPSVDVYLEMVETYKKGIASGEFTHASSVVNDIEDYVLVYPKEPRIYEAVCQLMMEYQEYEDCAELLKKAQGSHVYSEALTQLIEQLRYKYDFNYSMYTQVLPESGGLYAVEKDGVYSYLSNTVAVELDEGYTFATGFNSGYAYVRVLSPDGTEKHLIINSEGERQGYIKDIETSSGVGSGWDEKDNTVLLLACKSGEKYSYYSIDGEKLFGDYAFAGRFRNNVAAVMEAEGKWKLIDSTGKPIVDKTFTNVALNEFDECAPKGVIFAEENGKYSMYNPYGEKIGTFSCDDAKPFVDDYTAFKKGDKWGFVDANGNVIIEPQYLDAKPFSNKMGAVLTENGWVCIDPKNQIVIDETFEDILYLTDSGVCFVKSEGFWSCLEMYYTD